MKRLSLFLLMALLFHGCQKDFVEEQYEQENVLATRSAVNLPDYYYYGYTGEKIPLTLVPDKYFVLIEAADFQKSKMEFEKEGYDATLFREMQGFSSIATNLPDKEFETLKKSQSFIVSGKNLSIKDGGIYAAPFYTTQYGDEIGVSEIFCVVLKDEQDIPFLEKLAAENNVLFLGKDKICTEWNMLMCTKESTGNALQMANVFHETGMFELVFPSLLRTIQPASNDPLFSNQWSLYNASNTNVDINYDSSMSFNFPHINDVTVAVYDHGLEFNHDDLSVLPPSMSYDILNGGSSPSIIRGDHGMACAGIIGAITNNGIGVAGVASGVNLMSVSLPLGSMMYGHEIGNGFRWAVDNGADIISCSWGNCGSIEEETQVAYALQNGRNKKGTIVVFGSGNDDLRDGGNLGGAYISAMVPGVIAVGATNKSGNRFSDFSWGSNYGAALDVVAPGTNIPTTDRKGSAGYSSGDYYNSFNGTSSACPHVAGIAALMLAENPNLTSKQVADIIEGSAQKVGGYSYTTTLGRPNGTWNEEMGYGLVDAYRAVSTASLYPSLPTTITGPASAARNTNVQFSVSSSLPTGATFKNWGIDSSNGYSSVTGSSTNPGNLTATFYIAGSYTVRANFTLPGNVPYSISKTINVTGALPQPWISISPSSHVPRGELVMFTAMLSEPVYDWHWELISGTYYNPPGTIGSQNPHIVYSIAGNVPISIRCRALLQNGNVYTEWAYASVTVYDPPAPAPQEDEEEELLE